MLHRFFYPILIASWLIGGLGMYAVAHELHGVSPEYQRWAQNVEIMPEARKRLPWAKCCNHAEVFRTQFRVNKNNGEDEWFYLVGETWLKIPADIIHPHDSHAPDGRPTLFIYQGRETCFFVGESGG